MAQCRYYTQAHDHVSIHPVMLSVIFNPEETSSCSEVWPRCLPQSIPNVAVPLRMECDIRTGGNLPSTSSSCMFNFRRKEVPWEVVTSRAVDAVPMYYEDEDLDIAVMGESDIRGTYVFEIQSSKKAPDLRKTVEFARQQLLQEVVKKGYNVLALEGWQLTLYRRGKEHRIEVQYTGRPVRVLGKLPGSRPPPFMAVLETCH